jgi:hypothetical protein
MGPPQAHPVMRPTAPSFAPTGHHIIMEDRDSVTEGVFPIPINVLW